MIIKSYSFREGKEIPRTFTCDGANNSPSLIIEDIPQEAVNLVLIMDDPDATSGRTFTHWLIWNIPPNIKEINEGEAPRESIEGKNDFGNNNYGGPCPPFGSKPHRYMFKLYAIDKTLNLSKNSSKEELEKAIDGHVIEHATLTGLYARAI